MPRCLTRDQERAAVVTPRQWFDRHAIPVAWPGAALPRRLKSPTDWYLDADAIGAEIEPVTLAGGRTYYGWRRGPELSRYVYATALKAAQAVARANWCGEHVPAERCFSVSPTLADALESRGEIVRHMLDGRAVWGCTETGFDPDLSPVISEIFHEQRVKS